MGSAQAVFIAHNDTAQKHVHIVASRIDPTTGKTFSQEDDFAKGLAWSMEFEKAQGVEQLSAGRQKLHKMADAIAARDVAALIGQLTETNPTFTAKELDKVLAYGGLSKEGRSEFRAEILADKNVIGLRETADSPVTRYTTREVLAAEIGLLRAAHGLADTHRAGLTETRLDKITADFTLKPEQAEALHHLTRSENFAMLWGEAGTGKSHTLNATRTAYEQEGAKVIGLAWTNDVAQQMRGDGFKESNTIASELKALESGRAVWNKNTVLIVDEAAMVATEHLAQVAAAARAAGAKLILAGDDAQLSSIERGGMFETLRQMHGAAILQDVQRVSTAEQKTAFNQMHRGEFKGALQTFDKAGGIHWTETQSDALREMAARYTADVANDPDKRRFMFAFTNVEVKTLNDHARALHKERGELGTDHSLPTAAGAQDFATGDRIQFAGNGYGKKQKDAGLTNGRVGTITEIDTTGDAPRVTVALDTAKGKKPKSVTFTVGANAEAGEFNKFKLGYAGTIYRGQGRTLDQSYVCHSAQWRSAAAYVALTRHREDVQIFASRETVRGMEKEADRASFDQAAARATLDPAQQAAARNARDLDLMAKGLARTDNSRAATAYQIDDSSGLRVAFDVSAERTTTADARQAPESARRNDRLRAFIDAAQQEREAAKQREQQPAAVDKTTTTTGDRAAAIEAARQLQGDEKKKALQELSRAVGREVNEQEGKEGPPRGPDRGGGQSL
jgi:ATP-dependent exoDNAse (exonuclease V) alpha subunit